jgi:hypothetical protein
VTKERVNDCFENIKNKNELSKEQVENLEEKNRKAYAKDPQVTIQNTLDNLPLDDKCKDDNYEALKSLGEIVQAKDAGQAGQVFMWDKDHNSKGQLTPREFDKIIPFIENTKDEDVANTNKIVNAATIINEEFGDPSVRGPIIEAMKKLNKKGLGWDALHLDQMTKVLGQAVLRREFSETSQRGPARDQNNPNQQRRGGGQSQGSSMGERLLEGGLSTIMNTVLQQALAEKPSTPRQQPPTPASTPGSVIGTGGSSQAATPAKSETCESRKGEVCPANFICATALKTSGGELGGKCCQKGSCYPSSIVQGQSAQNSIDTQNTQVDNIATIAASLDLSTSISLVSSMYPQTTRIIHNIGRANQDQEKIDLKNKDKITNDFQNLYIINDRTQMFTLYGAGNDGVENFGNFFKISDNGDTKISVGNTAPKFINVKDQLLNHDKGETSYYGDRFVTNTNVLDIGSSIMVSPPRQRKLGNQLTGKVVTNPPYSKVTLSFEKNAVMPGDNAIDITWSGDDYDVSLRGNSELNVISQYSGVVPVYSKNSVAKGSTLVDHDIILGIAYDIKDKDKEYEMVSWGPSTKVLYDHDEKEYIIQDTGGQELIEFSNTQELMIS